MGRLFCLSSPFCCLPLFPVTVAVVIPLFIFIYSCNWLHASYNGVEAKNTPMNKVLKKKGYRNRSIFKNSNQKAETWAKAGMIHPPGVTWGYCSNVIVNGDWLLELRRIKEVEILTWFNTEDVKVILMFWIYLCMHKGCRKLTWARCPMYCTEQECCCHGNAEQVMDC